MIELPITEMIATLRSIIRAEIKEAVEVVSQEVDKNPEVKLKPGASFSHNINLLDIVRSWLWLIGSFYDEPELVELSERMSDLMGDDIDNLNREGLRGLLDPEKTRQMEQHPSYKRLYGGKQLKFNLPADADGRPIAPEDLTEAGEEKLEEEIQQGILDASGDLAILITTTKLNELIKLIDDPRSEAAGLKLPTTRLSATIFRAAGNAIESARKETNRLIDQKTLNPKHNSAFEIEVQLFSVFCHCLRTLGFVYDNPAIKIIADSMFELPDKYKNAPDQPDPQNKAKAKTHPSWDFISKMIMKIELATGDDGQLIALSKLPENHSQAISQSIYETINEPEVIDYFMDLTSELTSKNIIELVDDRPPNQN